MSKLLEAYTTDNDTVFKKVKGKDGNTYHFKDGTPVTVNSFNGGKSHMKFKGQPANVAVPSDKGPGYERIKVSAKEASALGQELRLMREDVQGTPKDKVMLNGEMFDTYGLAQLNENIVERYGPDAVMKY